MGVSYRCGYEDFTALLDGVALFPFAPSTIHTRDCQVVRLGKLPSLMVDLGQRRLAGSEGDCMAIYSISHTFSITPRPQVVPAGSSIYVLLVVKLATMPSRIQVLISCFSGLFTCKSGMYRVIT